MALRTGYSIPFGTVAARLPATGLLPTDRPALGDVVSAQLPLFLELGAKVTPNWFLGVYVGLHAAFDLRPSATSCAQPGVSCTGRHAGLELQYHLLPKSRFNPWFGYGIGYEWFVVSAPSGRADDLSGIEFARLSTGVDFRVEPLAGAGLFVDFAAGRFGSLHNDPEQPPASDGGNGGAYTAAITEKATHEWLTVGVRIVISRDEHPTRSLVVHGANPAIDSAMRHPRRPRHARWVEPRRLAGRSWPCAANESGHRVPR